MQLQVSSPSRGKVTTTHCVYGAKHEEKLQLAFAAFCRICICILNYILVYSFSSFFWLLKLEQRLLTKTLPKIGIY